ncbi:membrane protein [Gordonia phage BeeGee]|nr:membrane protein [Gordonia phage BeeGee]
MEPSDRRLRPTPMLLDVLAIIVCVAAAWWLIATAPDLH